MYFYFVKLFAQYFFFFFSGKLTLTNIIMARPQMKIQNTKEHRAMMAEIVRKLK